MFSLLRNRFGIPGVISVIALVFAMFGGAYAATNSGGGKATASAKAKKGSRGPKGSKGDTGPAGPAGPQGVAGANGKDGANGTNGSPGAPGKDGASVTSVQFGPTEEPAGEPCEEFGGSEFKSASPDTYACNGAEGSPWTAGGTLPKGETETGSWAVANETGTIVPISFPIPLATELSGANVHYVTAEDQTNSTQPTGCEGGTAANPKAAPGSLCIYGGAFFTEEKSPVGIFNDGSLAPGAGTTGAAMVYLAVTVRGYGSFAVTAP